MPSATSYFALFVALATAVAAVPQGGIGSIPVGGVCGTIAGPVNSRCVSGSKCCTVSPDLNLCTALEPEEDCPKTFIPEGELCSGFAGPVGTCYPGTVCCEISPDNSICATAESCNSK